MIAAKAFACATSDDHTAVRASSRGKARDTTKNGVTRRDVPGSRGHLYRGAKEGTNYHKDTQELDDPPEGGASWLRVPDLARHASPAPKRSGRTESRGGEAKWARKRERTDLLAERTWEMRGRLRYTNAIHRGRTPTLKPTVTKMVASAIVRFYDTHDQA